MAYVILPSDREFAWFLEWTELGRLDAERWRADSAAEAADLYDEQTAQMTKSMHIKPVAVVRDPVRVHDVHDVHDVHVPTVANFATTRPKFTFTDAQIAIAMAAQARQLKEAS